MVAWRRPRAPPARVTGPSVSGRWPSRGYPPSLPPDVSLRRGGHGAGQGAGMYEDWPLHNLFRAGGDCWRAKRDEQRGWGSHPGRWATVDPKSQVDPLGPGRRCTESQVNRSMEVGLARYPRRPGIPRQKTWDFRSNFLVGLDRTSYVAPGVLHQQNTIQSGRRGNSVCVIVRVALVHGAASVPCRPPPPAVRSVVKPCCVPRHGPSVFLRVMQKT